MTSAPKIKTAVIGFGFSAKTFHIPFVLQNPHFELTAISSSRPEEVNAAFPAAQCYATPEQLLDESGAELVIVTAPNAVHFDLACKVLKANKHLVIEKPFVNTADEAEALIQLAQSTGLVASVYQNRRWDGDFVTAKRLIEQGALGQVKRFESHFDRFRPVPKVRWREQAGPGSGILYDLGPHLIDQTLQLFGMPNAVTAYTNTLRPTAQTTDFFHLTLHYDDKIAICEASPYCSATNPRFNIQGDLAQLNITGLDPQEALLIDGIAPDGIDWGDLINDDTSQTATLYRQVDDHLNETDVAIQYAGYHNYFDQLAGAIRNQGPVPVTLEQAYDGLEVIEAAIKSSANGQRIALS